MDRRTMLRASVGALVMLGGCGGGGGSSSGGGGSAGGGGAGPTPTPTPAPSATPTPVPTPTPTPSSEPIPRPSPPVSTARPITAGATDATVTLYRRLCDLTNSATFMIGTHERFDIPGIAPFGLAAADNFQTMTGKRPAWLTYEWIDPVQVSATDPTLAGALAHASMRNAIRDWAAEGGIVSIHDHPGHPLRLGISSPMGTLDYMGGADTRPLAAIRAGGSRHAEFRAYLDRFAEFLGDLTDASGAKIPVLWRPFHEIDNYYFWWNDPNFYGDDMIAVWRETVTYLRDVKGVTNVLYVHNIDTAAKLRGGSTVPLWPGDTYVDVISVDHYDNNGSVARDYRLSMNADVMKVAAAVTAKSTSSGKPVLLAELGFDKVANDSATLWQTVFEDIQTTPALRIFGGVALWRPNWGPRPGTAGAGSLRNAVARPGVLTLGTV